MRENRMRERKKHRKETQYLAGLLICSLACCCSTGLFNHHASSHGVNLSENVARLAALERQDPTGFQITEETQEPDVPAILPPPDLDPEAEREKILALSDWDRGEIYRWFQPAAILGDSIAQATQEYGWLDDSQVFAKIGTSISTSQDLIQQAIDKNPQVVFLCFGLNDLEAFRSDVDHFIEEYTACIQQVQTALPQATIYVHALFPPDSSVSKGFYDYLDTYNQRLKELCTQLQVHYLDSSFILDAKPELYDADGIHPVSAFYPLWLTYLADVTGLSYEQE